MATQSHRSDPRILGRRTLERDHRCLAAALRPRLSVLDVGCGTGAITAGVAKAVGRDGRVVGIDRDEVLLELGRREHSTLPNLRFEHGDVTTLSVSAEFDIVTAARTLEWIAGPGLAITKMKQATKSSGLVVVLDYNHSYNDWEPELPSEFKVFYGAFLAWRHTNGWDNEMANHLPELFRSAGLSNVTTIAQDEVVERGQPEFDGQAGIWSEIIENVGGQLATGGFITELQLQKARECYTWAKTTLSMQRLVMAAVTGMVP